MNKKIIFVLLFVVLLGIFVIYKYPLITPPSQIAVTDTKFLVQTKVLDLSNQNLDKLPQDVLKISILEDLNISNNKISGALPSQIRELSKLKVLNASNNLMTGVPAEIGQLADLEVLDLSNNKLTGLPNELGNLKKLKVLNISGNDYSKMDLETIKKGLSKDVKIIY